jgi:hypothetical protein
MQKRGRPRVPEHLSRHERLRYRRPEFGDVYRREFERGGESVIIDPPGSVLVSDPALLRTFANESSLYLRNSRTCALLGRAPRGRPPASPAPICRR